MKKEDILKSLGWSEDLVTHFFDNEEEPQYFESNEPNSNDSISSNQFTLEIKPSSTNAYTLRKGSILK